MENEEAKAKRKKELYDKEQKIVWAKMEKAENNIMKSLSGFNQYQVETIMETIKHKIKFNSIVEFN